MKTQLQKNNTATKKRQLTKEESQLVRGGHEGDIVFRFPE